MSPDQRGARQARGPWRKRGKGRQMRRERGRYEGEEKEGREGWGDGIGVSRDVSPVSKSLTITFGQKVFDYLKRQVIRRHSKKRNRYTFPTPSDLPKMPFCRGILCTAHFRIRICELQTLLNPLMLVDLFPVRDSVRGFLARKLVQRASLERGEIIRVRSHSRTLRCN